MKNVFLTLMFLLASVAQAATVNYHESTDGDLGYITAPAVHDPFVFDVGLNTFSGSMDEVTRDLDTIYFEIQEGLLLTSVHLTYWYVSDSYANTSYFTLSSLTGGGSLGDAVVVGNDYCLTAPPGTCAASSAFHWQLGLPAGSGEYWLQPGSIGANGNSTQSTLYYEWEFGVVGAAAVPVPASFWLFGSALGILGWLRRKVS